MMLRVIEKAVSPARFLSDPDVKLETGNIVRLIEKDNNIFCTLCKGERPFGLVTKKDRRAGFVFVLLNAAIVRTDKFESDVEYKIGDFLYSSDRGWLTSFKANDGSIPLANVISIPSDSVKYIEFNWI